MESVRCNLRPLPCVDGTLPGENILLTSAEEPKSLLRPTFAPGLRSGLLADSNAALLFLLTPRSSSRFSVRPLSGITSFSFSFPFSFGPGTRPLSSILELALIGDTDLPEAFGATNDDG